MNKRTTTLQITGGLLALAFIGTSVLSIRKRRQDRLANVLLKKLINLNPIKGLANEEALSPLYKEKILQSVSKRVVVLKKAAAIKYANAIHSAFKPWYGNDDEEQIYSVFRNLKDKVQVSQVAKAYQDEHGESLKDSFKKRLSKSEIKIVLDIISKLHDYRTY